MGDKSCNFRMTLSTGDPWLLCWMFLGPAIWINSLANFGYILVNILSLRWVILPNDRQFFRRHLSDLPSERMAISYWHSTFALRFPSPKTENSSNLGTQFPTYICGDNFEREKLILVGRLHCPRKSYAKHASFWTLIP